MRKWVKSMRAQLRKMRQGLGLSQRDMAVQLGIDRSTYVRYETGLRTPPLGIALRIAQIFETGAGYLFATDIPAPKKESSIDA